ncbi:hypothetical protein ACLB2K_046528 [Fragaria x ananassa]
MVRSLLSARFSFQPSSAVKPPETVTLVPKSSPSSLLHCWIGGASSGAAVKDKSSSKSPPVRIRCRSNFSCLRPPFGAEILFVAIGDLDTGKVDLSGKEWTYQDLKGNTGANPPVSQTLIWYKVSFLATEGKGPLALDLASMGKGQAWVNGQGIGRYWSTYVSPSTGCNSSSSCELRLQRSL